MSDERADAVRCPFCSSTETGLISLFGQQLLTVQYYCRSCRTPFERVKDEQVMRDATRLIGDWSNEDHPV